jgi:hypothetical protein
MRHARLDPDEREETEARRAPQAPAPAFAALLRMQATAGNHATSRYLEQARLARAPSETQPPPAKEQPRGEAGESTATIDGLGHVKIHSFQWDGRNGVTVTMDVDGNGPVLSRKASGGERIATVTITNGAVTITLTDVLITSYQVSSSGGAGKPTAQVSFEGAKVKVD